MTLYIHDERTWTTLSNMICCNSILDELSFMSRVLICVADNVADALPLYEID